MCFKGTKGWIQVELTLNDSYKKTVITLPTWDFSQVYHYQFKKYLLHSGYIFFKKNIMSKKAIVFCGFQPTIMDGNQILSHTDQVIIIMFYNVFKSFSTVWNLS